MENLKDKRRKRKVSSTIRALAFGSLCSISTAAIGMSCGVNVSQASYGSHLNLSYGGISLNKTANLLLDVTDIQGAAYDKATGQIIFYGKSTPSLPKLNISDMAVAVQSVYGLKGKAPQNPGVSINTEPSSNPNTVKVRYDGALEGTAFGHTLFEADRILKSLTMGLDNITGQHINVNAPGFKHFTERFFAEEMPIIGIGVLDKYKYKGLDTKFVVGFANDYGDVYNPPWVKAWNQRVGTLKDQRIWIEPGTIRGYTDPDTQTLSFDPIKMKVLVAGSNGVSTVTSNFADFLEKNYDAVADQYPVFHELKRLGKITAIVKWIQDNDIPLDLSMFEDFQPEYGYTPTETPKKTVGVDIAVNMVGGTADVGFSLSGGITYQLNEDNYTQIVQRQASSIMDEALNQRPQDTHLHWSFNHGGTEYTAIAQTLERSRKDGNFTWSSIDAVFPTVGNLSLTLGRYYNSFSESDEGLGIGWHVSPMGLRFSGDPLSLSIDNKTIKAHMEFVLRTGSQEMAYTLLGVSDGQNLVYRAEQGKTQIEYDPSSETYTVIMPSGSIQFDASGKLILVKDAGGQQLAYRYENKAGKTRMTSIEHSGGREISFTYDNAGKLASVRTPNRLQPVYTVNSDGQLSEFSVAGRTQSTFNYDSEGRLNEVKGPDGKVLAKAEYDIYKRAKQIVNGSRDVAPEKRSFNLGARKSVLKASNGFEQTLYYDDAFRPLTHTDEFNRASHYRYDSAFGPTRHVDAKGNRTDINYDSRGNLSRVTNANGQSVQAMYNDRHQPILTADVNGNGQYFVYDKEGNLVEHYHDIEAEVTPEGRLSGSFNYDAQNRTRYTYNNHGQVATVTNAMGYKWAYHYNSDGQLKEVVHPDRKKQQYRYDSWGRLESVSNSLTVLKALVYDELDRVISVTTPNGVVLYEYDEAHRITQTIDANGNASQFFWQDSFLTQLTDANGGQTHYAYDHLGSIKNLTRPNGSIRQKHYDKAGRLIRIVEGQ